MVCSHNKWRWLIGFLTYGITIVTQAEIVTDGSMGQATTLTGPNFAVIADLGRQEGFNLFHSFSLFNLNKEETATFSGPSSIINIIGRITSSERSSIDGRIRSDIPQANLYLINANGFIFGPNASFNVSGSLHLSTATVLKLGDSGQFSSRLAQNSLLVSAPPTAFGFLDSPPATIIIQSSRLGVGEGKMLSLAAGEIRLEKGGLVANAGRINLVGVTTADSLAITPQGIALSGQVQLGKIVLQDNASIDVGKQGAGEVFIRSGEFELNNSDMVANTFSNQSNGIIDIDVNELRLLNGSSIDSRTFGLGRGGQIRIRTDGRTILDDSDILTTSLSSEPLAGNAGDISVTANQLDLINSSISTATAGRGHGGDIQIRVTEGITLTTTRPEVDTAIRASSASRNPQGGNAGRIFITSKSISLTGEKSQIDNSTIGSGQGGNIILKIADRLILRDDAFISADSNGSGNAGSITVSTDTLSMDNGRISTAADKAEGGNIIVSTHHLLDMNNSQISATVSGGSGNGGNLIIGGPRFFRLANSKITANASAGNGGVILIFTGLPVETHGSTVEASSQTGNPGEVRIDSPNVELNTLPIEFLDASMLMKKRCAVRADKQMSSFVWSGRGGLPNAPNDLQSYLPPPSD